MTLQSSLMAFFLIFIIALTVLTGASAVLVHFVPATAIFTWTLLIPNTLYLTKQLIAWTEREL